MTEKTASEQSKEIIFTDIIKKIFLFRYFIIKMIIIFFIIGVVYALLAQESFKASTAFVPQVAEQSKIGSNLGGLAALAGINLNSSSSQNGISPLLYPKILMSSKFKLTLLESVLYTKNGNSFDSITYRDYLKSKKKGFSFYLKKYTIGLPKTIISSLKKETANSDLSLGTYYEVSKRDYELFEYISESVSLNVEENDGYVNLSVLESNPDIAAQLAVSAKNMLQETIISLKIANSKNIYDFTLKQYLSKQLEVRKLQDSLAKFKDSNRLLNSSKLQNELLRIENSYNISNTVYIELAKQLENAKIQLNKDTPIFITIQPVTKPNERVYPKRMKLVLSFAVFGFLSALGMIILKPHLEAILTELKR